MSLSTVHSFYANHVSCILLLEIEYLWKRHGCGFTRMCTTASAGTCGLIWRHRFEPCEWSDLSCHALVDVAAEAGTPLTGIVGHHKNAGTWLKGYAEAELQGAAAASPY